MTVCVYMQRWCREEVRAFPIIILLISQSANMYLKLTHAHHPGSKGSKIE